MKPHKIKMLATSVGIAVLAAYVSSASAGQDSPANSDPALATAEAFVTGGGLAENRGEMAHPPSPRLEYGDRADGAASSEMSEVTADLALQRTQPAAALYSQFTAALQHACRRWSGQSAGELQGRKAG